MHGFDTSSLLTFSVKAKPPTSIASDQNSRIAELLLLWFSSLNDLNDWNGAQRWNPSIVSGQVGNALPYQVSEAVEPFDSLRAGFWNDWHRPPY